MNESQNTSSPASGLRIVVGVDGSDASIEALRTAGLIAAETGGSITAITTWRLPATSNATSATIPNLTDAAERTLASAVQTALGDRGQDVSKVVREGRAGQVMVHESRHADLVVLGSRGHGGFAGLLLGSVSKACAGAAECPTLIVRGTPSAVNRSDEGLKVVAGVELDAVSPRLLRMSAEIALRLEATFTVVSAWQSPVLLIDVGHNPARQFQLAFEKDQTAALERVFPEEVDGLERVVKMGSPKAVLLEAAADATLLVLGRSTSGTLWPTVAGATSLTVAEHATCSVLVVPTSGSGAAGQVGDIADEIFIGTKGVML